MEVIARHYEEIMMPYSEDGEEAIKLSRILGNLESDVKTMKTALEKLTTRFEQFDKRLTESEVKTKLAAAIVVLTISAISGLVGYFIGK